MSEKYDDIIESVYKYYYYVVSPAKTILLSSSNSLADAKEKAIKKLEPQIKKFIGKKLVFIKISNTYDKFKKEKANKENLNLIGGPIAFEVLAGLIDDEKKINNEKETGNNKYYLSKKYIKSNIDNIIVDLPKIAKQYLEDLKSKSFIEVNIL